MMNDDTCGDRRRRLAWPLLAGFLGAMACIALLAAACGGSPSSAAGGSAAYQDALPFAQCMRSHGIGNFPDPDSSGNFDVNGSVHADSPQYAAAQRTCVRLHPYNMVLSPHQVAKMMAEALKFARCMRAHGVPNFPDPTENNGGISFGSQTSAGSPPGQGGSSPEAGSGQRGTGSGQPTTGTSSGSGPSESPQFQAATQACQSHAGKGKS
jgi:hypothetical protein